MSVVVLKRTSPVEERTTAKPKGKSVKVKEKSVTLGFCQGMNRKFFY